MYNNYTHVHVHVLHVCRCIAWEPNERPSISALLNHLYSLLAPETLPSRDDSSDDVLFNHTHSLGHVVVEVDLDETDIDSDLLEFLIANQVLHVYRRTYGFDCVLERLRKISLTTECDSNNCTL